MLFTRQKHGLKLMLKAYTLVERYQRLSIQRILMNFLANLQLPKRAVEGLLQRGKYQLASLGFLVLNPSHTSAADVAQEDTTRAHARRRYEEVCVSIHLCVENKNR